MRRPAPSSLQLAVLLAAATFALLLATASAIPIIWDEGEYLWRSGLVRAWFHLLTHPRSSNGGFAALSDSVIATHWKSMIWEEGHPGAGTIAIALGSRLFDGILHPLTAARSGTIAVFALACGMVSYRVQKLYGGVAAIGAIVALLTFPRIFSEAHFATLDAQLLAWWLIVWALEASDSTGLAHSCWTGVAAGVTAAVKFPGWLAWGPLLVSRLVGGAPRARLLPLVAAAGIAAFWLTSPPLWHEPISRFVTHVELNLHRTLNVPIQFFGTVYALRTGLPWYNTLLWLLIVTPVPTLVLGAIGLLTTLKTRERAGVLLLLNFATMMVARALPGTPPHDGIRLFLPAFGFWCVLAGIGAARVWDRTAPLWWSGRVSPGRVVLIGVLVTNSVTVGRYFPQTLSHYNALVGGLRGAATLGMEPTYWWDALDGEVLDWINTHTGPGQRVAFSAVENIGLLRAWKRLVPEAAVRRTGDFQWYVLQNRTGFLATSDRWLMSHEQPAFVKFAGLDSTRRPAPDLNVPLILIYSFDQYQRGLAATRPTPDRADSPP